MYFYLEVILQELDDVREWFFV